MSTDKFVRVDVPKTIRSNKKLSKEKFLEEVPLKPQSIMRGNNWRKEMGKLGVMLKSDYDKGEFLAYGLDEERVLGNIKADQLEKENVDLQKQVAELQAKLAEKVKEVVTTPPASEETDPNTEKETENNTASEEEKEQPELDIETNVEEIK